MEHKRIVQGAVVVSLFFIALLTLLITDVSARIAAVNTPEPGIHEYAGPSRIRVPFASDAQIPSSPAPEAGIASAPPALIATEYCGDGIDQDGDGVDPLCNIEKQISLQPQQVGDRVGFL